MDVLAGRYRFTHHTRHYASHTPLRIELLETVCGLFVGCAVDHQCPLHIFREKDEQRHRLMIPRDDDVSFRSSGASSIGFLHCRAHMNLVLHIHYHFVVVLEKPRVQCLLLLAGFRTCRCIQGRVRDFRQFIHLHLLPTGHPRHL